MATSFSEQLQELLNPLPKLADPEDDHDEATKARLVDAFAGDDVQEEVGVGTLRKKNAFGTLAESDGRYLGQAVSRQQLFHHMEIDQQDDDDDVDVDYYDQDLKEEKEEDGLDEEEEDGSVQELDEEEDEEEEERGAKAKASELESDELSEGEADSDELGEGEAVSDEDGGGVRAFSGAGAGEEAEKGEAVRRQLALWDRLLRTRIQMQKALGGANLLPRPRALPYFRERGGAPLADALRNAGRASRALRSSLADLHLGLLRQSAAPVPETPEGGQAEETAARRFAAFRPHADALLREWQDKTRAGGGRFAALERDAPGQVERILADRERLLRRTRTRRSEYRVLGDPPRGLPSAEEEKDGAGRRGAAEDEDAFDDDDFYHQLLRELIQREEAATEAAGGGGPQWLRIQKLRGKMKKKQVDTKASKGRKVRFHAHAKLLNFMAPVIRADDLAHDACDQLFRGLFAAPSGAPDARYILD